MIGAWSPELGREYVGLDARYDLPARPLGPLRLLGVILVGFGLAFAWGPARALWTLVRPLPEAAPSAGPALHGLFEIPFLIGGAVPLVLGLLVLVGHCRVEWREGRLRSAERLGPIGVFTRRLPAAPPRALRVLSLPSPGAGPPGGMRDRLSVLVAEYHEGPQRVVALAYPRQWLLALAHELSTLARVHPSSPATVEVTEADPSIARAAEDDAAARPDGSGVDLEEWRGGLRMRVPAAGLWRGSHGLFPFAVAWCLFMAFFTVGAVTGKLGGADDKTWMAVVFGCAFWAIGLGLMTAAVHMGRRTAAIEAESGRLRVTTRGLFGVRERAWSASELAAIRVDAGGWEVNDRPVPELQIHPRAGGKVGLLGGRAEGELRWIAARLRRALDVPSRPAAG